MNLIQKTAKDHYFVFNERPFSDWGYVLSADNTYNTPSRDVDSISIPGRNGAIHIDHGRWNNIDVTYTCFIEDDFDAKFNDFKRYVSSLRGYQRLEDTFHPGEYRMATLNDGIKINLLGTRYHSGKFDVTFNCKPQRFLKSGEIPVEIPCSPAASPASARRYWRLSNFSQLMQTSVTSHLSFIGYTSAEINAMQFEIITIPDESIAWASALEEKMYTLEINGVNTDRFFAFLWTDDPTTATGQGEYICDSPVSGFRPSDIFTGQPHKYICVQKAFGTEVYYNERKIAQDETYQFGELVNPTRFDAIPKFRITLPEDMTGMAGATVYMVGSGQNGIALKWTEGMENYINCTITLDAELMDAYILPEDSRFGEFVSLNSSAKFYGNRIVLASGENTIRLDPMIAGCEIEPRWWTI